MKRPHRPHHTAVRVLLAAALLAVLPSATAQEASVPPRLSFSGFGTLGAVTTDDDDVWFTRYGVNHPGDRDPDFSADSLIGLQTSLRLSPFNDLTVQAIAMEDGTARQDPRLTLAFVRQVLAPGVALRVGRVRVPFFMLSDSLHVNFANPWVHPPVEVYGLNPFNDLDGVDLIYVTQAAGLDIELHPYYGSAHVPFPDGRAKLKETWGLNLVLAHGNLSLHLGHGDGRFTLQRGDKQFRDIVDLLAATGQGHVVADLSGTRGRTSFDSVGVQWDDGRWQFVGEYAKRWADRYVGSAHGWYLSLGRRIGSVTPYVSVARQTLDAQFAEADLPAGLRVPLGNGQHAEARDLWALFLTSRNNAQRSITVGARWDVAPQAALKAEFTRAHPDRDSWGSYFPRGNPLTTRIGGRTLDTFSVSVDVSF